MNKLNKYSRYPRLVLTAFWQESAETSRMFHTFLREGRGWVLESYESKQPSEAEMQAAMEQLKDLPRFLPFFVCILVPLPGVTEGYALVAVTLEKWMGHKFHLLPSEFRKVFHQELERPVRELEN
ncbi:MAG: hypothetical protein KGS48_05530 [Bacteroidetes bacterium]|nr:hypothetical protein [Bacteroidota bacterium]